MRILIIQTAFIGDVVLSTPLIEKLSEKFPEATIDFLLRKGNENLFDHHPKLNQVLIWNKQENKIGNLFRMISKIRKERYDLVINLQRFGSTGLMTFLSGAKEKIGFKQNPFSFSFDYKVEHDTEFNTHEVERNLKLIEKWVEPELTRPKLYLSEEVLESVESYKSEPYIVVAPTSVWFTKQFPEERWIKFLKRFSSTPQVYLIGGKSDRDTCQRIIDAAKKGTNLCGELSLIQSVALIKDAKMNYTNDSAPMHFASAVNAPTTAIFCSTVPVFGFGPLAEKSKVVQMKEYLECRPCGLHGKKACPEGHFKCAHDIDLDELIDVMHPELED